MSQIPPLYPKPTKPRGPEIVGRLIADLLLGALSGAAVWAFDGPTWGCVATGVIVFQIMRAAGFVVGMGRRGWR